ncbi:hypothetical protein [Nocardia australiensis]|uniref:hypothetical protein n=1 Tax=Nocardia australiensis TaxID=2887191 RepID=UPI001D15251C|nr:hypothetical protein [Nocardia australiensis]
MRRPAPEPAPGFPQIQRTPGLAQDMLREMAPFLAEEGIDVDNLDGTDPDTLQAAFARAIERHNMIQSTPVGVARDNTLTTLRTIVTALISGDATRATALLDAIPPTAADRDGATVAGTIGVAASLLDDWLARGNPNAPQGLAIATRLPAGHWTGERAATDLLALARKHRAFTKQDAVIANHGGLHVLYGLALALTATIQAWAQLSSIPDIELIDTYIA